MKRKITWLAALAMAASISAGDAFAYIGNEPMVQFINRVYTTVLGRAPQAAERGAAMRGLLGGGLTRDTLVANLFRSSEYANRRETPEVFARALTRTLLCRDPLSEEVAEVVMAKNGGMTVDEMVNALSNNADVQRGDCATVAQSKPVFVQPIQPLPVRPAPEPQPPALTDFQAPRQFQALPGFEFEPLTPSPDPNWTPHSSDCMGRIFDHQLGVDLSAAVQRITSIVPVGGACDPRHYSGGFGLNRGDFYEQVWVRMHACGDMWITQAYLELFNRTPSRAECDIRLYNNGHWNGYADLKRLVRAVGKPRIDTPLADRPVWKTLVVILTNLKIEYDPTNVANMSWNVRENGRLYYQSGTKHVSAARAVASRLPDTIRAWSGGRIMTSVEVVVSDTPVNRLHVIGTDDGKGGTRYGYTLTPELLAQVLQPLVNTSWKVPRYDSVVVIWPDQASSAYIDTPGGFAYPVPESAQRAGVAVVPASTITNRNVGQPAEELLVHEWVHTLEAWYEYGAGRSDWAARLPHDATKRSLLDSADVYGFTPWQFDENVNFDPTDGKQVSLGQAGTWKKYIMAFLQGSIGGGSYGLSDEMVRSGGPSRQTPAVSWGTPPANIAVPRLNPEDVVDAVIRSRDMIYYTTPRMPRPPRGSY